MSDIAHSQLDKKFDNIDKKFDKMDKRFDDLMDFLVENVAMKSDIKNMATKDDIAELRAEFKQDIAKLDHKLDQHVIELRQDIRAVRDELASVKRDLARLEKMVIEDIDAYGKSIVELKQRVKILEQQVQALQSV